MIPIDPQPEPAEFDTRVRQKGRAWLQKKELSLNEPLPVGTELPAYWQGWCLQELHRAYGGICAYLGVYVEQVVGGATVDHYLSKKAHPGLAYEWTNYRFSSAVMNSRKGEETDVLDPFTLAPDLFHLDLLTGAIRPRIDEDHPLFSAVRATIERLRLDEENCRKLRRKFYLDYRAGMPLALLRRDAPFVYQEAVRQGRLTGSVGASSVSSGRG